MAWLRRDGDALVPLRLLLVLSVLGPAVLFSAVAWYTHHEAFRDADQDLVRLSEVAREHAEKVFDTHRLIASQINAMLKGMDDAAIIRSAASLHDTLARMVANLPQAESVLVTGRNGQPLVSADVYPIPPDVSMADRDYFSALSQGPDRTFVSAVHLRRLSGGRFFGLAYRRDTPDGNFAGVIDVLVRPSFFERFYHTLVGENDAAGTVITLLRTDGVVLARYPPDPQAAEQIPASSPFFAAIRQTPQGGSYVGRSSMEPAVSQRYFAFRLVGGHALYVVAGRSAAAINATWLTGLGGYLVLCALAAVTLFWITLTALRGTRREQLALRQAREEMERRERAEAALRELQKLEAIGKLTAGVAHDFNNLLTVILANLESLSRTASTHAPTARSIQQMQAAVTRGARLTSQLLTFSRRQRLSPEPLQLNAVVSGMEDMLRRTLGGTIRIETQLQAAPWVALADRTQLDLAILNLAINARDAMKRGGTLTIATANTRLGAPEHPEDPPAGDYVAVSVADTGSGMEPGVLARAFEPFFTTKPQGDGSGLGLSQVYGFARQSGGGVRIISVAGNGTRVTMYLPRAAGLHPDAAVPAEPEAMPRGDAMILVVDDDPDVRAVTAAMLADLGYTPREAGGGASALALLATEPEIALGVLDYAMPGMNGIELARRLRETRPGLPVLFVTGYGDASALAARDSGDLLLQKPFTAAELAARVAALLGARAGAGV